MGTANLTDLPKVSAKVKGSKSFLKRISGHMQNEKSASASYKINASIGAHSLEHSYTDFKKAKSAYMDLMDKIIGNKNKVGTEKLVNITLSLGTDTIAKFTN